MEGGPSNRGNKVWLDGVIMGRDSTGTPITIQMGFVYTYLLIKKEKYPPKNRQVSLGSQHLF